MVCPTMYKQLPFFQVMQRDLPLPYVQGGGGPVLPQGPQPMWSKILQQPSGLPQSYTRFSSTNMICHTLPPSHPTMHVGPLHHLEKAPLLRPKRPPRPPPPKTLHQQPSGAANQVQISHDQLTILARNPNLPSTKTMTSHWQPVQTRAMFAWITLS